MGSLLNVGRGLVEKPRPYDAEVEYLEKNFTSNYPYINTGITATTSITFEVVCSFIDLSGGRHGCNSTSPARFYFGVASNKFICGINSTSYNHSIMNADNDVHTFTMSPDGFYIDGVKKVNAGSTSNNGKIQIFEAVNSHPKCKVYSSKIYDGNVLVRDYIPVRVGRVGYLYDKVSGTLFAKSPDTANNFILGPDKI